MMEELEVTEDYPDQRWEERTRHPQEEPRASTFPARRLTHLPWLSMCPWVSICGKQPLGWSGITHLGLSQTYLRKVSRREDPKASLAVLRNLTSHTHHLKTKVTTCLFERHQIDTKGVEIRSE